MFTFELLGKLGIIIGIVSINLMLSDLVNNAEQLKQNAINIESSQRAMEQHTLSLIQILEQDPALAYNANIQHLYTQEKLNKDTESHKQNSQQYIQATANQIEQEILAESTEYTAEQVEQKVNILLDEANKSL